MAEEQQDVETLKRRGRRRLVGAVALVLLAVIVLPMVFDPEPKSTLAPVEVRIPSETDTTFAPPKPAPKAQAPAPKAEAPAPKAQPAPPPAAQPAASEYVIQVGAFSRPESVIARLVAAKLPYYTEPMQGNLTRVRAGPFASREAADRALSKLKELGLKPGAVTTRAG
jgi:DedD protein